MIKKIWYLENLKLPNSIRKTQSCRRCRCFVRDSLVRIDVPCIMNRTREKKKASSLWVTFSIFRLLLLDFGLRPPANMLTSAHSWTEEDFISLAVSLFISVILA